MKEMEPRQKAEGRRQKDQHVVYSSFILHPSAFLLSSRFSLLPSSLMSVVIKTVNLTKRYGTLVALSNLNLEISAGDCFGFIGPNGAEEIDHHQILATLLSPPGRSAGLRLCRRISEPADQAHDRIRARLFWRL